MTVVYPEIYVLFWKPVVFRTLGHTLKQEFRMWQVFNLEIHVYVIAAVLKILGRATLRKVTVISTITSLVNWTDEGRNC